MTRPMIAIARTKAQRCVRAQTHHAPSSPDAYLRLCARDTALASHQHLLDQLCIPLSLISLNRNSPSDALGRATAIFLHSTLLARYHQLTLGRSAVFYSGRSRQTPNVCRKCRKRLGHDLGSRLEEQSGNREAPELAVDWGQRLGPGNESARQVSDPAPTLSHRAQYNHY